jgi:hypothetical protein
LEKLPATASGNGKAPGGAGTLSIDETAVIDLIRRAGS